MLEFEVEQNSFASIKVVGCGGAGGNAVIMRELYEFLSKYPFLNTDNLKKNI